MGQNIQGNFSSEFCMVITLDHHHPAHQLFFCRFGDPIAKWRSWRFGESKNCLIAARKAQYMYRFQWNLVCSKGGHLIDVAYKILANYSKPILSNRGMYSNVWSNQGLDIHDARNQTTSKLMDFIRKL